ncbi:MAG: hypothetical protein NZ602_16520 [Thermoguttaceae bacterium]|nr:hypothetical protein [Thermoguttaceae bacterium]
MRYLVGSSIRSGQQSRRGVLLLVILGLLAMFSLIALTFVIVASQAKRSALAAGRAELYVSQEDQITARVGWRVPAPVSGNVLDPYVQIVHEAFLRFLRGVAPGDPNNSNPANPALVHSLLEDIYGTDSLQSTISGASMACGNALVEVSLVGVTEPWWLVGRVVTVLDGPAKGLSTHIVGYNPTTQRVQLRTFQNLPVPPSGVDVFTYLVNSLQNRPVLINGAPFSGRGFLGNPIARYTTANPPTGEANEDYDAPDHQNMHLALAVPLPLAWPSSANAPVPVPIPSFHRADLVRYWQTKGNSTLAQQSILRPMPSDHPNFTGSNPGRVAFDPTWDGIYDGQRSWDVDNDGDGIPDSVWIDLGLPVRSTPDGQMYKPLVAILCLDLDGRLNLNAHGSLEQTTTAYSSQVKLTDGQQFATGRTDAELVRGIGFGPADINLLNLCGLPPSYAIYERIFKGGFSYDGRYGSTGLPGFYSLCWNKHWSYPDQWQASSPLNCRAYGTPPDIRGTMAVGLDVRGQPIYANLLPWGSDQFTNNPYQVNLGPNTPRGLPNGTPNNNPFSPAELERILRASDLDANLLPPRLAALTSSDGNPANSVLLARRMEITTESWDVPVAPFAFNVANPEHPTRPRHVVEALLMRYGIGTGSPAHQQLLTGRLLPPELLQGLKMDLNRPWGDGLDNNSNGVIDEAEEAALETFPQQTVPSQPPAQTDLTQGTGISENLARQLYARYLYCLALTLWDLDYLDTRLGGRPATCRFIAQWAVNVVDFRDRDSIMTCFEYDPNPFTAQGWRCDGDPATNDGINEPHVVWGCERPELLITETLALHDRRVEDLNTDSSGKYTTDKDPDDDFDQRLRPRGSLFVELYNPWTTNEPIPPELYGTGSEGPGVDLTRRAPDGTPVWRLVIVPSTGSKPEPDPAGPNAPAIERSVYFVNPGGTLYSGETAQTQRYYPSAAGTLILPPDRYALLGPAEKTTKTGENPRTTFLGIDAALTATQTEADVTTARRIELNPAGTPPIQVLNNGTFDFPTSVVKRPLVVLVDEPYRLSVTEPTDKGGDSYYPATDAGAGGSGAEYDETGASYAGYQKPFDTPLDKTRPGNIWDIVRTDGYHRSYRVIHLQRLANPLAGYDAQRNPYITIDTMPIDLITFNGIADDRTHADHSGGNLSYAVTRERGEWWELNDPNPTSNLNNLWRHEPEDYTPVDRGAGSQANYRLRPNLAHSLGFLNYRLNRGAGTARRLPNRTGLYLGDPQYPFPWLTWLNRPFANQYELMLVPATNQYELLHNYRTVVGTPNPYQAAAPTDLQFPHLANFFHSGRTPRGTNPQRTAPLLYRLFDYVGVPSPFIYTEIQVPPDRAATSAGHFFRPPFNRIPLYREPGRININTLSSPGVGEGLVSNFPGLWDMSLWDQFVANRKGSAPIGSNDPLVIQRAMITCDPNLPSRFSRPFRSWFGSYLTAAASGGLPEPDEIESTLLRSVSSGGGRRPLLEIRRTEAYAHCDFNPYFRYQGFQKVGNLLTTRSNVYAIWITVGYFEVDSTGKLGQELGLDRGEVRRHRAFYIIDRSIPVAFQRGQDHNVEKCILLRRFIE